jgi:hypothetical protein
LLETSISGQNHPDISSGQTVGPDVDVQTTCPIDTSPGGIKRTANLFNLLDSVLARKDGRDNLARIVVVSKRSIRQALPIRSGSVRVTSGLDINASVAKGRCRRRRRQSLKFNLNTERAIRKRHVLFLPFSTLILL